MRKVVQDDTKNRNSTEIVKNYKENNFQLFEVVILCKNIGEITKRILNMQLTLLHRWRGFV